MDMNISGRRALVFGAGGGLGGAISRALAREGVHVVAADIHLDAAQRTADLVREHGGQAEALHWDLAALEATAERAAAAQALYGGIDILINNTGGPPPTPVAGQSAAAWRQHFDSMVLSVISITDALLPAMRAQGWGRVITSASSGVIAPIANLGLSNALRASLLGWSKTLAREVAPQGITANVVVPGRIGTGRIVELDEKRAQREGRDVSAVVQESMASIPLGRYGRPDEYADMVTFLASERASYVTGSVLRVDGGLLANI